VSDLPFLSQTSLCPFIYFHLRFMRIRIIVPITGLDQQAIGQRLEYLREIADPHTTVEAVQVKIGPPAIESASDSVLAGPDILRLVKEAEADGCDAAIIWCGGDPALDAARELVDIPIVGPGESMLALASILGRKPCRITPDIPVLEMRKDLDRTISVIKSMVEEKVDRGIGDTFVLGCLALWGLGKRLREAIGVPILDGAEASLKMAELAVEMGLKHSRIAYPRKESQQLDLP
jgi:allantoin racemase